MNADIFCFYMIVIGVNIGLVIGVVYPFIYIFGNSNNKGENDNSENSIDSSDHKRTE